MGKRVLIGEGHHVHVHIVFFYYLFCEAQSEEASLFAAEQGNKGKVSTKAEVEQPSQLIKGCVASWEAISRQPLEKERESTERVENTVIATKWNKTVPRVISREGLLNFFLINN